MLPYFVLFALPALAALVADRKHLRRRDTPWALVAVLFVFVVGFRDRVGADWWNYVYHLERELGVRMSDNTRYGDLGFVLLNRIVVHIGGDIHLVNSIASVIFMGGLILFCRSQPRPWLSLAIAVPYLVVVVAMGYTRQATAIGLILAAFTYLARGRFIIFVSYTIAAALFHSTALVVLPVGVVHAKRGALARILMVGILLFVLPDLVVSEKHERLWEVYVEGKKESEGAWIRTALNVLPAVLLLVHWRQWRRLYGDEQFWIWVALGAVGCGLTVSLAPTAVDRIGLYCLPLQMVVLGRLPRLWSKIVDSSLTILVVVVFYGIILYVWLHAASHAWLWIPYRNALLSW